MALRLNVCAKCSEHILSGCYVQNSSPLKHVWPLVGCAVICASLASFSSQTIGTISISWRLN
eukprot:6382832-Amphidinium_carterae.2